MKNNFERSLKLHFPNYKIESLNVRQGNVKRLVSRNGVRLVAKDIVNFYKDREDEHRKDNAFVIETTVLKQLPDDWHLKYVTSYIDTKTDDSADHRVIVTREIPNVISWADYIPTAKSDLSIVRQVNKQLEWLHDHGIVHYDLELKNILLQKTKTLDDNVEYRAIVIDFEKSFLAESEKDYQLDYNSFINSLLFYGLKRMVWYETMILLQQ